MYAHRFESDREGKRWRRREYFDCVALCVDRQTGRLDPDEQADRCCALPGFDTRRWTGGNVHLTVMGQRDLWGAPVEEDANITGCPGSQYRTPWLRSLKPYMRRTDMQGNRIANPLLDRCDDRLVLEALNYLEEQEDLAYAEHRERVHNAAEDSDE